MSDTIPTDAEFRAANKQRHRLLEWKYDCGLTKAQKAELRAVTAVCRAYIEHHHPLPPLPQLPTPGDSK